MWFLYALVGAVFKASTNFFRKKIAGTVDTDIYLWANSLILLAALTPLMFVFDVPVVALLKQHPLAMIGIGSSSLAAVTFNIAALKREELSYIAPLNAFIPIFALGLAWLFLGEAPPTLGIAGIVAVFVGAYIVNLRSDRVHWYEPIAHVIGNTGARFGIGVALVFAGNAVLVKSVSNQGFSVLAIMYGLALVTAVLTSYVPLRKAGQIRFVLRQHTRILLGVSLSSLGGIFFGLLALSGTFSSYAVSVRRLDIIISVLLGWHLLKEKNIPNRLIGSVLMTAGVIIIVLS